MGGKGFSAPLVALALALALLLPFTSLPMFALGAWDKAEPMVVGFHAISALAALAVAVDVWRRGEPALARISHPYVLAPLALGLWSLVTAPATAMPMLSVFGAPQSGFGALWNVDFAILCAVSLLAAENPKFWRSLWRFSIVIVMAVALLKVWDWGSLHRGGNHLLIYVAGYYGWLALPLALAENNRSTAVFAAALVALASFNMTAVVLLAFGLTLVWAAQRGPKLIDRAARSRRFGVAAVLAASVLPLAALQWVPLLYAKESLHDRHLIQELIEADLANDPAGLIFGHGWGRTQDAFQTWLNSAGQRLWMPDWEFLKSDYFHSHNWLVESLHDVGIPGMLLTLAGFLVIPVFAAKEKRPQALAFAVALAVLHGLWFQLCLSLPAMAMGMALLADQTSIRRKLPPRLAAWGIAGIGAAQMGAAIILLVTGLALSRLGHGLDQSPPRLITPPTDFRGSDLPMAEVIRERMYGFVTRAKSESTAPMATVIIQALNVIDARVSHSRTIFLITSGLDTLSKIYVTGDLSFAAADGQMEMWRRWLDRLLVLAPQRTDQAIGYFTAMLAQGRFDEVAEVSKTILTRTPTDPVGLYYGGLTLVVQSSQTAKAQGMGMIRQSLANGIDRFMPIDPALRTALIP